MTDSPAREETDWRTKVLFDAPRLRPLVHWVSERPLRSIFVSPYLALAWYFALKITVVGPAELLALLLAFCLAMGAVDAGYRFARNRRANACSRFPHELWRHDRAWDERGETRSWFVRMAEAMDPRAESARVVMVVMVLCGVFSVTGRLWWTGFAFYGVLLTWLCALAWRVHGAGDARLSFSKFPFHPGERVALRFGMSEGGAQFRDVTFRLFHVTEFRGGPFQRKGGMRVGVALRESRPPGTLPGSDFDVEVSFDVPEGALGTRLTDDLPQYWVLEVRGGTTSGPYVERFLVPIYERPLTSA